MAQDKIIIRGAREHNLKWINLEIPRDKLVVITGLSGSGKSSLAFDTIYAEGRRRYVESLSAYARQFLGQMEKPDVDYIEGLSPAISIEQKTASKNPRSTVGTITEIYDYLRLLYARIGKPHCYKCGRVISQQTPQQIVDQVLNLPPESRIQILAPVVRGRKGEYHKLFEDIRRQGYVRVRVNGVVKELEDEITLAKNKKHNIEVVVDRLVVKPEIQKRLADSVETALKMGTGIIYVEILSNGNKNQELVFSQHFACLDCGISFEEITPRLFSFNSPHGACSVCGGLGSKMELEPALIVPDSTKSFKEGAIEPLSRPSSLYNPELIEAIVRHHKINPSIPWEKLNKNLRHLILCGPDQGNGNPEDKKGSDYHHRFGGVIPYLNRRYQETSSAIIREEIEEYTTWKICPTCQGARLRPESLAVTIADKSIYNLVRMSVKEARRFFTDLRLGEREMLIARQILKEIQARLGFLENVGLDYVTLERMSATLSSGEAQRIHLATQIGASLVGVLYILDEPSIGLHQRDNKRLLDTLKRLRDIGNTVLVVEHDEETIRSADYVIDMGPGAGTHGGEIVAVGPPEAIVSNPNSLTGKYLSRQLQIPVPKKRRPIKDGFLEICGAREHNLKNITAKIPLRIFTCITGVSGSGKSTLVNDILYPALSQVLYGSVFPAGSHDRINNAEKTDKVINITQDPIGRTPRSNPATYTGVFTCIRDLFARLPESKIRGYRPGRYSFNVKGGRCEACGGDGIIKIEMHFLPDVYIPCEVCKGKRYNRETLEIHYKGKNIAEVLDMLVEEALVFFKNIPRIRNILQTLYDVGLGYLKLGQPATTLSGGEAQRVKLATELCRQSTGNTLYILDEPTTGLHFADIQKLLDVLNRLTDAGNTVVVIEHNLDVIKTADYIIDLGPEGGDEGGWVVACGTPEQIAQVEHSYTGQFLKRVLGEQKQWMLKYQVAEVKG